MRGSHTTLAVLGLLCLTAGLSLAHPGRAYAQIQTLPNSVTLLADPAVSTNPVPTAQTFTITQAGSYTITLTDLLNPQALAALSVAVATPSALIVQLSTSSGSPSVSKTLTLQAGTYTEQVLATAAAGAGGAFGNFSVQVSDSSNDPIPVTPVGGTTSSPAFVGVVASPSTPVNGQSVLDTQFTVTDAGPYQLTLADLNFPAALQPSSFSIALWNLSNSSTLLLNEPNVAAATYSIDSGAVLPAGTYEVVIAAQADTTQSTPAGLYSLSIHGGSSGSSTPLATTEPVGSLPAPTTVMIPSNESLTFTLTDLKTPAQLSSLQGILVEGATLLQPASPAGTYSTSSTTAGTAQLYIQAQPNAGAGQGSFAAMISAGSGTLLDIAQPVIGSSQYGYGFKTTLSSAGSYQLNLHDFQVPQPFVSVTAAVEQAGNLLGTASLCSPPGNNCGDSAGSPTGASAPVALQPQAGALNVIVFATPAAQTVLAPTGGGLFGLQLTSTGSATPVYQVTQGVGASFSAQAASVTASGQYTVNLVDLGFPIGFQALDLIVTQGQQIVGQIAGAGSFQFSATAGTYTLNVLARTGKESNGNAAYYGLYGLQMTGPASSDGGGNGSGGTGSTSSKGGGGALSPTAVLVLSLALLWILRRRRANSAECRGRT